MQNKLCSWLRLISFQPSNTTTRTRTPGFAGNSLLCPPFRRGGKPRTPTFQFSLREHLLQWNRLIRLRVLDAPEGAWHRSVLTERKNFPRNNCRAFRLPFSSRFESGIFVRRGYQFSGC